MGQPLREPSDGLTVHAFSPIYNWEQRLKKKHLKQLIIEATIMAQEKYVFDLVAVAILKDHVHFVIKTYAGEANISKIMQYIKARSTEKFNKAGKRSGTLWDGRFKSVIIEKQPNPVEYLLYLIWYIAYNSVRNGEEQNPRSSYVAFINCYLDENYKLEVLDITPHYMFMELGDTHLERVWKFLKYEQLYLSNHPEVEIR